MKMTPSKKSFESPSPVCWKNWKAWSEAVPELETPGGTVNARVVSVVDAPAWIAEVGGFGVLSNADIRGTRLHCCAPRRASCI